VIGTAVANAVMTALQWRRLSIGFNGRLEGAQTVMITVRILVASAIMAVIARLIWELLRSVLGESFPAEVISVGVAVGVSLALYAKMALAMRIPEARQIQELVAGRLRNR
jgi:peptidoglycan biosynthesis protein MviN/MurJ (putative lipid II flippase)